MRISGDRFLGGRVMGAAFVAPFIAAVPGVRGRRDAGALAGHVAAFIAAVLRRW
jgi:hypothetical protein